MSFRNAAIILGCWTITRVVIFITFARVAPDHAMSALGNWDGAWYGSIVDRGYEFVADGARHNVAFFPLFPLLSKAVTTRGVGWPLAGVIVNNAAFLGALFAMFLFVKERIDESVARWTIALACFFPTSLFCSVAYSEGLFLLTSSLALLAFQRQRFIYAGLATAAAVLTRPFGIALAAALVVAALVERRRVIDVLACSIGLASAAIYPVFCWQQFDDPFAFVHAQMQWRPSTFDPSGWRGLLRGALENAEHDRAILLFLITALASVTAFAKRLGTPAVLFAAFAGAIIGLSGSPISVDRFLYALLPVLVALALILSKVPGAGYLALAGLGWLLIVQASAFAQGQWVA